jgi:membrane fusion protein, multidrug efflux system
MRKFARARRSTALSRRVRHVRLQYWILFVLALLLPAATAPAQPAATPGVIVAEAQVLPFPVRVEGLGTVRAMESIEIRPKIAATVTAIRFTEGQRVQTGEILIELEDAEVRAAVAAARAVLADSQAKLTRGQELFANNLISESELESLLARRDADRAALAATEARLADTVVRAPFSGQVGLRRISLGALVGPATVITTLDDTDTVKLDFDVPETALSRLAVGLPITAHSAAWPDSVFVGRVATVDTRVDPVSRSVTVRGHVPNARGLLRPGMFLLVELVRDDVMALVIPEQAVVPEQSRQFVFVVGAGEVIERREVQLGRRRAGVVEVLGGLTAGETVVAEGVQRVQAGERVRIVGRLEVGA